MGKGEEEKLAQGRRDIPRTPEAQEGCRTPGPEPAARRGKGLDRWMAAPPERQSLPCHADREEEVVDGSWAGRTHSE